MLLFDESLDEQPSAVEVCEDMVPAPPASSDSDLTPDSQRILKAIDELPQDEREVFGLIHIQGLMQDEPAELPRIRGYEAREVLGRGGMGIVYKAWHLRLQRPVAVKMLLAGAYAQPHELERFLREAETVAGLRHANIVQVHEAGDVDGRPYFAMEFV